jgi:hypothetical protein
MKKILIFSLILTSCKTQDIVQYEKNKSVVVNWETNSQTFDVYRSDSLVVQKIPCDGINQLTLHNYDQGDYKFIFKNDGVVTEEKLIKIVDKK